jgi:plasminogen activator inhibitor 1 RNA-binding protein
MSRVNAFALLDDSDDEAPKVVAPAPAKKEVVKTEKRRPNNNDRNTKGGRGPREARDGKRTFDRRSGTGRGKETKKGGGGRGNWGSDKNEARTNEGPVDENAPVAVATETEPEAVVEEPVVEEPVVVEEEDITMTMDEYLAAKSASAAGESLFGSKKQEKTIEDNEFAGKAAHVAVEGDFLVMGAGKKIRKRAEKKEVQKLDVNFRVASAADSRPRDDGERGAIIDRFRLRS